MMERLRFWRVLLGELGVWREEVVGFKEKVKCLAKEKGDDGKVAFLESVVGLSLSSAMNIARHSSAETLLGLIDKVRELHFYVFLFRIFG